LSRPICDDWLTATLQWDVTDERVGGRIFAGGATDHPDIRSPGSTLCGVQRSANGLGYR
jgi:hypothetical protein